MSNKDLFKEAIADAKAVREAALANAKVALEEALAPRLQNMISAKLQEMDEDLDEAEDLEEAAFGSEDTDDPIQDGYRKRKSALEEDEDLEEDFDLSEILAELEADDLAEAKKKKKDEKDLNEAEEGEEEEGEEEEEEEVDTEEPEIEDAPEETSGAKVEDLTVDELKDIIKDIISAEMGGAQGGGDEMDMDMGDMGGEEGDEIAVDEMYGDEMTEYDTDPVDEELDLEELLAELDALDESDDDLYERKKSKHEEDESAKKEKEEHASGKEKKEKSEMNEAIATINTLRAELNEVNLLNAKLLYVNKIFKARNLNESQKLKVIAQFDKATTAREAKTIYESMSTAIAATSTKKSSLKESIGFASKAAGIAPKKNIVEVDETMSRWQMLAGIKKF